MDDYRRIVTAAGGKTAVVRALSDGSIAAIDADSDGVRQHASNLEHWLNADALYGVQHVQVSKHRCSHVVTS